jgi:hypothetical protein
MGRRPIQGLAIQWLVLGAAASAWLVLGCASAPHEPAAPGPEAVAAAGLWEAAVPGGSDPDRLLDLELSPDGRARLLVVSVGRGAAVERGRWSASARHSPGPFVRVDWEPAATAVAPAETSWTWQGDRLEPRPATSSGSAFEVPLTRFHPSRPPAPGCAWSWFADAGLGIRLVVQRCADDPSTVLTARGAVRRVAPGQDPAEGVPLVEVFPKLPEQPVPTAIHARFFPSLVRRVRRGCVVERADPPGARPSRTQVWRIVPTETYREATRKWRSAEPAAMVCGPYGEQRAVTYFEYRPEESLTRYVFVRAGTGSPSFDEVSIRLLY